jgi:hypothetical protein
VRLRSADETRELVREPRREAGDICFRRRSKLGLRLCRPFDLIEKGSNQGKIEAYRF